MSVPLAEYEHIKLDLLHSLARSQRALAVMTEHLADLTRAADGDPVGMLKQIESMAAYQRSLAEHLLRIRLRKLVRGQPTAPWINGKLGVGTARSDPSGRM